MHAPGTMFETASCICEHDSLLDSMGEVWRSEAHTVNECEKL